MNIPEMKRLGMYKYKDVTLPEFVVNKLENIENFETSPDDIWVVSFPRSGEIISKTILKRKWFQIRTFIMVTCIIKMLSFDLYELKTLSL